MKVCRPIVGIDLTWLRVGKNGGGESYVRNLLAGLSRIQRQCDYALFATASNISSFAGYADSGFEIVRCAIDSNRRLSRVLYQNCGLPCELRKKKINIAFFPTYGRPVMRLTLPSVCNVNDVQFKAFPHFFPWWKRAFLWASYRAALALSDKVVAISESIKTEMINHYGRTIRSLEGKVS
jgi:hypothetical protein